VPAACPIEGVLPVLSGYSGTGVVGGRDGLGAGVLGAQMGGKQVADPGHPGVLGHERFLPVMPVSEVIVSSVNV